VLAAAVLVTLRLLSASRHNLIAGVAAVVFASLVWMPVTRRWSARAHLCWASTAHGILALHFSPRRVKDDPAGILREIRQAIGKGLERPPLPIKGLPPDD